MQISYVEVGKGSRDLFLKLWDPFQISGTSEAKNFKFGMHIDIEGRYRKNAKLVKGVGKVLLNFGTFSISGEWLKLETSHLARTLITGKQ